MKTMLVAIAVTFAMVDHPNTSNPSVETWTGWFSDQRCARTPAAGETVKPNGTECVKQCLLKGTPAMFLSEQANAVFAVRDYPTVRDDVGYYVEVTGVVDTETKSISVRSVKRLAEVGSMCALPKKPKK